MAATNEDTTVTQESQAPAESDATTPASPIDRASLTMGEFHDMLAFDGTVHGYPTTHAPIIRDTPEILIYANRSPNTDGEYEVRGLRVLGDGISFNEMDADRADVAAIMIELFDSEDLTIDDEYSQQTPVKHGVPVAVAADGEPAIAAWRYLKGASRGQVAHEMGVSEPVADDYLSQFRERGTGIPDEIDVPEQGEVMPEVPERFNPEPNGQTTFEELADLS